MYFPTTAAVSVEVRVAPDVGVLQVTVQGVTLPVAVRHPLERTLQALALLQGHGMAACTVSHTTARIGDARSTLDEGLISHANAAARSLGAREGTPCREWVEVLLSRAA